MSTVRTLKELEYHRHTDSLLMGPVIGTGETFHGRLTVQGSGGTVRFTLEGVDGYVDLPLGSFAAAAVTWLAGDGADTV